jgi:vacuolar-type H+-ATPase subunit H
MSRSPHDPPASKATPHELVLQLETSIETRLAAAEQARAEVERAQQQAIFVITQAAEQAVHDAQELTEGILADARTEAARVTEAGTGRAADLTALTARRRDEDVAAVVAAVLPARLGSGSGSEAASRP